MAGDARTPTVGPKVFAALLAAYLVVWAWTFPATYGIDDEANILSLATAISKGTVFLDRAGISLDADLEWNGHRISKFSPFHAGLLAPAVAIDWRWAFLIAPAFFVTGAFIVRAMLRRHQLSDAWTALYFLDPGLLYYSRTLLAAVPAAVMGLAGAFFLFRDRPRPVVAGVAFSLAVALHVWMAPLVAVLVAVRCVEQARQRPRLMLEVAAGAAPLVVLLGVYNLITTGNPLLTAYGIIGVHSNFAGTHWTPFLAFYLASIACAPLAGWAVLRPRWSGSWAVPVAAATVIVMASAYYYRDGLEHGLSGWIPGRRFLLPVSVLACVPAARMLAHYSAITLPDRWRAPLAVAAVVTFVLGFSVLSVKHQQYLRAQADVQSLVRLHVPNGSCVLANDRVFKAFAPVDGQWTLRLARGGQPLPDADSACYRVWLDAPGRPPVQPWIANVFAQATVSSWAWSRALWIAAPEVSAGRSRIP